MNHYARKRAYRILMEEILWKSAAYLSHVETHMDHIDIGDFKLVDIPYLCMTGDLSATGKSSR